MLKTLIGTAFVIVAFFIYPPIAIAALVLLFIYAMGKTSDAQPFTSLYAGVGYSKPQPTYEPRPKDYHDYQIEAYLANKQNSKMAKMENTGLTYEEELTLQEIEQSLDNK